MAKPKHIDLTEDGVITQEALLAYAEGKLSDAERAQVDKLIKDDPFAQDALDGLRSSGNKTEIKSAISAINTQLREKTGVRERKKKGIDIHWANYAYAAVVLGVLIGVGYVMINVLSSEHREEAMNKPVPKAQESMPVVEKKKEELKPDTTKQIAAAPQTDSMNLKTTDAETAKEKDKNTANVTSAGNVVAMNDQMPAAAAKAAPAEAPKSKTDIDAIAAQLGVARTFFGSGDYISAEKEYNKVLTMQPDNSDALYFGGICAYYNSSRGFGEANFDKLAKTNQYTEGTKWYKAAILIKKGKKEEAKPLLRDLINGNSYFKERAVKQYEELFK
jgi:tetratricopeptide (TPR) repeat protein